MTIAKYANTLGIDWSKYGCFNELREKIKIHGKSEYYVYREGYVISNNGKIKEPSIYIFDRYFKKIKGTGHSEFGARPYDDEYQIFLDKESALEYASYKQKEFMIRKESNKKKELELLIELAKKYGYTLIKN